MAQGTDGLAGIWTRVKRDAGESKNLIATIGRRKHKELKMENVSTTNATGIDIMELCNVVRQAAFDIHVYLGHGHLEKVYENALTHRLRKRGFNVWQQNPIVVYDEDGTIIGEYFSDLLIEGRLLVELKAAKTLADEHIAQLLGYLKSTRIEHGLLINFGSYRFQIKKYIMTDTIKRSALNIVSLLFVIFALFRGQIV